MSGRLRDPIPVGPFLWWCHRRETQIRGDHEPYPSLGDGRSMMGRLCMELGWDEDTGRRRLFRWCFERPDGLVERSQVEDALFHADVLFEWVYPDLAFADECCAA